MAKVALILFSALSLASCASLGTAEQIANTPVAGATAIDEKALYTAEAAYNFTASTYVDVVNRHLLSAATKAVIKPKVQEAGKALKALRAAYAVGDAATFGDKYRTILALKSEVCTLTGKVCS
jgi:hypothetical protein